jgi:hypothetical protein
LHTTLSGSGTADGPPKSSRIHFNIAGRFNDFGGAARRRSARAANPQHRPLRKDERMEITLTNRSRYLAIVTLNSGRTLHLAPSHVSDPIDDVEINGNAKVDKLVNAGELALNHVEKKSSEHGRGDADH